MEIEGRRKNSKLFVDNNFLYRVDKRCQEKVYYRCVLNSCKGRGIKVYDQFSVTKEHNHQPDQSDIEKRHLVAGCKRKAEISADSLRSIFDAESSQFPNGAVNVAFGSIESTLAKRRRQSQPQLPSNADDFVNSMGIYTSLSTTTDGKTFYKTVLRSEDGSMTAVFVATDLLSVFGSASEIHTDGTFKVVPRIFYQLCTIYFVSHDYVVPAVYALMTTKTENAYYDLFSYIKTLVPTLSPRLIMSDYEKAIQNAMRRVFPDARISGCYFHYTNALWKKVQKLGMTEMFRSNPDIHQIVKLLMSLPLLPHDLIVSGFQNVMDCVLERRVTEPLLARYVAYVEREWLQIVGVAKLSVYGLIRRTNNDVESFHSSLRQRIGVAHPNAWKFVKKLQDIELATRQDHARAERGLIVHRWRKHKYILQDRRIIRAKEKLELHRVTTLEYLKSVSYCIPDHQLPTIDEEESNPLEDDIPAENNAEIVEELANGSINNQSLPDWNSSGSELSDAAGLFEDVPSPQEEARSERVNQLIETYKSTTQPATEGAICKICVHAKADAVILPCFHALYCLFCANLYNTEYCNKCPDCRVTIEKICKIYQ